MIRQPERHNRENCDMASGAGGCGGGCAGRLRRMGPFAAGAEGLHEGPDRRGDRRMGMFWLTAGALLTGAAVALLLALRRGATGVAGAAAGGQDLAVYRAQLAEVDRDLARGVIAADEAQRLRTEVSRRILEADRATPVGPAPTPGPARAVLAGLVLAALAGGMALYLRIGAPGYADLPLAERIALSEELRQTRPGQAAGEAEAPPPPAAKVEPEFLALMEKLRAAVAARPDDAQGLRLLAQNEARLGNFAAAWQAQERLVALLGARATGDDHATQAELMIFATGGYVSPEAEAALTRALRVDPANGTARYYAGLMFLQVGRPDQTFRLWRPLLEGSAPDAPWVAPIRARMAEVAAAAGERYALPEAGGMPGPDAGAMAAAQDMTPEERQAMIEGMVQQLNDRLAAQGGTAEEWARLIGALGVLGQTDRAAAIWAEAQVNFAGREAELATLRAAAEQAGIAP